MSFVAEPPYTALTSYFLPSTAHLTERRESDTTPRQNKRLIEASFLEGEEAGEDEGCVLADSSFLLSSGDVVVVVVDASA